LERAAEEPGMTEKNLARKTTDTTPLRDPARRPFPNVQGSAAQRKYKVVRIFRTGISRIKTSG
jgi:hypothetical protein